jgi:tetratricopeptide (TPR) repeat protein
MGTPEQPRVDGHEGSSEESDDPAAAPGASTDPDGGVSLEPDLQALFFRARLAQYQIRKAEDSGLTDHRSHLDLGAAYAEMGLTVESARELTAAAAGGGHVAARAVSMLLALARNENTDSELALEILGRLHAETTPDSLAEVLEELHERWGESHPRSGRLAELRGSADAAPAAHEEQPELAREPEEPVQKFTPRGAEEPSMALEALDAMLDSLEGDTHEDVLPAGHTPVETAAGLCAEADRLVRAEQEEDASVRLFEALELLEDARELREAVDVVDRLLALRPDDVVLHHQRAEFALGLNDRSLLVESYMALASSLRRQQAPESARTVYARILEIDPDHSGASKAMESLAERTSTSARAEVDPRAPSGGEIAGADSAVPAGPADFDALLDDLRDPGTGGAVLEGDTQAHFELGIAFKQMEMWEEAIAELEQAVVGREDPRPVWEAMAECCVRTGERNRALEILHEAESHPANLSGPSPMIWYRIALLLEETGDRAGAVERLRRVIAVEPEFMDAAARLSALSV